MNRGGEAVVVVGHGMDTVAQIRYPHLLCGLHADEVLAQLDDLSKVRYYSRTEYGRVTVFE